MGELRGEVLPHLGAELGVELLKLADGSQHRLQNQGPERRGVEQGSVGIQDPYEYHAAAAPGRQVPQGLL